MKKLLSLMINASGSVLTAMAFFLATKSAMSTCFYCLYQPDVPSDMYKLCADSKQLN